MGGGILEFRHQKMACVIKRSFLDFNFICKRVMSCLFVRAVLEELTLICLYFVLFNVSGGCNQPRWPGELNWQPDISGISVATGELANGLAIARRAFNFHQGLDNHSPHDSSVPCRVTTWKLHLINLRQSPGPLIRVKLTCTRPALLPTVS